MADLGALVGPLFGIALFVALAGGRLPNARPRARGRALTLRWLWLGVLAGVEELIWRGLVLGGLAAAVGAAGALLLSAGSFAVWHAPGLGRWSAVHVLTGVGFGTAFLVGGLAAAILAHATYNVVVDWGVQAARARP
jgi:membrane protease YdiL (CAAX protease family)